MKKTITLLLITVASYSYGQNITPYVDIGGTWVLPMEGKVSTDIGLNVGSISIEANGLFVGHSRMGGTVGYQFGERGSEYVGLRVYGGSAYGKFLIQKKEIETYNTDWRYVAGIKLMQGSLAFDMRTITNLKKLTQTELYISVQFQIVEIIKWATR